MHLCAYIHTCIHIPLHIHSIKELTIVFFILISHLSQNKCCVVADLLSIPFHLPNLSLSVKPHCQ